MTVRNAGEILATAQKKMFSITSSKTNLSIEQKNRSNSGFFVGLFEDNSVRVTLHSLQEKFKYV